MILDKNNQSGATMMEALGVLTIIIMLGVSVIKLVGNIFSMFNQAVVVSQIKDLQKVISERYRFEGNYANLFEDRTPEEVTAFLCDEKMAPFQMCNDGLLFHKSGGEVWIMPVENYDEEGEPFNDYNKYAMTFWSLSDTTCINAAQINWYSQKKSDVYKMVINSGTDKELVVDVPYNIQEGSETFPVPAAEVFRACSNNDNNQIEWIFY